MRILQGTVIGLKMPKTVTVEVRRYKKHPKYQKRFRTTRKYHAHCEETVRQELEVGTAIYIMESKPISKLKHWVVIGTEDRKELISKFQVKQVETLKTRAEIKNLSDKKVTQFPIKKRKINSNKRKTLAAQEPPKAAPAQVEAPKDSATDSPEKPA
jgi:small subunit ribosomal protein S17